MRLPTHSLLPAAALFMAAPFASAQVDIDDLSALSARSIGPAGMSGRVAAVCAVESNPNIIYVGAATGGLWKSVDGGLGWRPLFDDQPVASIGAVSVFQRAPEIVWVGTGEGNPRNSTSVGKGIFRSLDAGATWKHLGLEQSEKIHRIVLHPSDPDIAFAGALGPTWSDGEERGVYRTTDGGATWERVLYVDERTGCADLIVDPRNPDKLFAAMWSHRREPHFFTSGGPGSGLYVSRDGGDSWTRLSSEDGLPSGELGRIGLGIAPSQPDTVYALVEAEESALVRSDDGGRTWRTVNDDKGVASRPFYYADIRVDPADPERVYNMASTVRVSDDGGAKFRTFIPWSLIHPDHHAMWINPNDPKHIIEGNDGGVAISRDHGATWRFARALPLAQFYHIAVDDEVPYNIYGGMQDNGSWRGPSDVWENGGVRNHHWREVGFGDGFATLPLPGDSTAGYAMSQGGSLLRWDLATGERRMIRPDGPEGVKLRFNWNAAIAIDPRNPDALYYGSQFLHYSSDQGASWEILSPDLTTDNPEWQRQDESGGLTPDVTDAENYCSIITIAPSTLEEGLLWVGTDDGRLHITRDGGGTWESLAENVLGVTDNTWIPHVEASSHDAATAFVVFDDHRRGDWTTQVYRTTDYGKSWTNLATPEIDGYAHVIRQDPVEPRLLYLGTEFGLWITLDGGRAWMKWTHGFPTVAVRDLVVERKEHDLVIGTHGRAAWVIDDISPLRAFAAEAELLEAPLRLLATSPAQQHRVAQTGESRFPGSEEFRGETSQYGASFFITMNLDDSNAEETEEGAVPEEDSDDDETDEEKPKLELEIFDANGERMRRLTPKARSGFSRIRWDLRRDGWRRPGSPKSFSNPPAGPQVAPGDYRVVVRYGDHEAEGAFSVLPDPRVEFNAADWDQRYQVLKRIGELGERMAGAIDSIDRTREDISTIVAKLKQDQDPDEDHPQQELLDSAEELKKAITAVRDAFVGPEETKGIESHESVRGKLGTAGWGLGSSSGAPSATHLRFVAEAEAAFGVVVPDFNRVLGEELAEFRKAVDESGVRLLPEVAPL